MAPWPCPSQPWADGLLKLLPLHWIAQSPRLPAELAAELPPGGIRGQRPLAWWAAGAYRGRLRQQLLRLRNAPSGPLIGSIVQELTAGLRAEEWPVAPLLVPIPSWKKRANPMPAHLVRSLAWQLGWSPAALLERSRAVLGQHHLGRELRWANQDGAFRCLRPAPSQMEEIPPILLIDDILTTGATACGAADALAQQGWQVVGMACLARTPARGCDLRSTGRSGDGPG